MRYTLPGARVALRPIEATLEDAYLVTRWRNTPEARAAFFCTDVVTPDTHMQFMANRHPHDLVFIIEAGLPSERVSLFGGAMFFPEHKPKPIGMCALTVDVKDQSAEWGRIFMDPAYKGQGYAEEAVWLGLHFAFDLLQLRSVWADIWEHNTPIQKLYSKVGYSHLGTDLEGHARPDGHVVTMIYRRSDWKQAGRERCMAKFGGVV